MAPGRVHRKYLLDHRPAAGGTRGLPTPQRARRRHCHERNRTRSARTATPRGPPGQCSAGSNRARPGPRPPPTASRRADREPAIGGERSHRDRPTCQQEVQGSRTVRTSSLASAKRTGRHRGQRPRTASAVRQRAPAPSTGLQSTGARLKRPAADAARWGRPDGMPAAAETPRMSADSRAIVSQPWFSSPQANTSATKASTPARRNSAPATCIERSRWATPAGNGSPRQKQAAVHMARKC